MKVNTSKNIIEGVLTGVDPDGVYFRLDCEDNAEKVYCDRVLDIMPIQRFEMLFLMNLSLVKGIV